MNTKHLFLASLLLLAGLAACKPNEDMKKETPKAPKVEFTVNEDSFSVPVEEVVDFSANVVEGNDVQCLWTVDGEKVAGTPSFKWKFSVIGVVKVRFEASNELGKVEKEYTVTVQGIPLEVSYSEPGDALSAVVGTPLELSVSVVSGDKATKHSWSLDGETVGSETSLSLLFTETQIGQHLLEYAGENSDGMKASHTWTVSVVDLPLAVEYNPAETEITAMEGDQLNFSASVKHGATGIEYSWKLDGSEVSKEASYSHLCTVQGTFTITVDISNASGEKDSRNWTVTVNPKVLKVLIFDDFENSTTGVSTYYLGNLVNNVNVVKVVDNPYKTSVNSSSKVLVDECSLITWVSSGYFKFAINTYPDGRLLDYGERSNYTRVRIKIYVGNTGFTPLLQEDKKSTKSTPSVINGVEFNTASPSIDAWNAAIRTNDWNEFIYDLASPKYSVDVNNLADADQLQFRVTVDFNNNGKTGQNVYFDDIEFLE